MEYMPLIQKSSVYRVFVMEGAVVELKDHLLLLRVI